MKNYFKFNLTGQKLLPYWLLMLLLIAGLALTVWSKMDDMEQKDPAAISAILFVISVVIVFYLFMFAIVFFMYKLSIENIEYKDQTLLFGGKLGQFLGIFLLGMFLSIITLGIYIPWFIKKMQSFFVDNSSYDSNNFEFKGKGGELFLIMLITFFIPYVFIMILTVLFTMANNMQESATTSGIIQVVTTFILIPYMYFMYKWMVNIKYKSYSIVWQTDAWDACGKIFVQVLLSVITLGIYYPLAIVKLYKYFAEKTVATSDDKVKKFGYDIEPTADFLFIWGQVLLTMITLGIYSPWAGCKITSRILGKSYSEEIEVEKV